MKASELDYFGALVGLQAKDGDLFQQMWPEDDEDGVGYNEPGTVVMHWGGKLWHDAERTWMEHPSTGGFWLLQVDTWEGLA